MLPCAGLRLNRSILRANGKESQKELHAFQATALLMAGAKANSPSPPHPPQNKK